MKCVFTKPPVPRYVPNRTEKKPKRVEEKRTELPVFKIKKKEVKDESESDF